MTDHTGQPPAPVQHWCLSDIADPAGLGPILGPEYAIEHSAPQPSSLEVLDDFGWDLWHAGALLLRQHDGRLCLRRAGLPSLSTEAPAGASQWWELPDGELRQALQGLLGAWSFQPVAELVLQRSAVTLRDSEAKIIARGDWLEHHSGEAVQRWLSLAPLRGYERELAQAAKRLDQHAPGPCSGPDLRQLLLGQGVRPRVLERKPVYGLQASEDSETCVRRMARRMVEQARVYEPGILDDVDTEFLHQYRVSLRKARALLALMKAAFAPRTAAALKQDLSALAAPTGQLRDLDVFLLDREANLAVLAPPLGEGFEELIDAIRDERRRALGRLRRTLRSEAHALTCQRVLDSLARPAQGLGKLSARPIQGVVNNKAGKRYQRIVARAADLDHHTPDAQIHALRIECKKLRYLMEFFAELYPAADIKALVGDLKGLQDVLGRFNDYCVQIGFLMNHLQTGTRSPQQAAAIGGLVAVLHRHRIKARRKVHSALQAFAQPEVQARFADTFNGGEAA